MRGFCAAMALAMLAQPTRAAIDLQKIQDDYQNQVALSVVAVRNPASRLRAVAAVPRARLPEPLHGFGTHCWVAH
jgi:hypothetical protein|eukprot:COSAG02_NODE_1203_length_13900_cov_11.040287_5_plen_75_part_00